MAISQCATQGCANARYRNLRHCNPCKRKVAIDRDPSIKERQAARRREKWKQEPEWAFRHTVKRHGLTADQITTILATHSGRCDICQSDVGLFKLKVDHDHNCCKKFSCGKCIRGFVCHSCNITLGKNQDDPVLLQCDIVEAEDLIRLRLLQIEYLLRGANAR